MPPQTGWSLRVSVLKHRLEGPAGWEPAVARLCRAARGAARPPPEPRVLHSPPRPAAGVAVLRRGPGRAGTGHGFPRAPEWRLGSGQVAALGDQHRQTRWARPGRGSSQARAGLPEGPVPPVPRRGPREDGAGRGGNLREKSAARTHTRTHAHACARKCHTQFKLRKYRHALPVPRGLHLPHLSCPKRRLAQRRPRPLALASGGLWAAQWGQREEGVASLLVMPQAGVAQHCPRQPSPVRGEGTQPAGEHVRSVWGSPQCEGPSRECNLT